MPESTQKCANNAISKQKFTLFTYNEIANIVFLPNKSFITSTPDVVARCDHLQRGSEVEVVVTTTEINRLEHANIQNKKYHSGKRPILVGVLIIAGVSTRVEKSMTESQFYGHD